MRHPRPPVILFSIFCLHFLPVVRGEDRSPPAPLGWIHINDNAHELFSRPGRHKATGAKLAAGTLCPVFKTTEKDRAKWVQVRLLDLASVSPQTGWVEAGHAEILPPDAYPQDSALLTQIGAPYIDDFAAQHTQIARFLLRQGAGQALLLCYVFCSRLPVAKLVAFRRGERKFLPGASLDFPISELHAGPLSLEVRDLLGNAHDCFITHEPFREGPETRGMNFIIRGIEGNEFRTLWQAPLEFRSLTEFRSKLQILDPPEKNIAAPGTVTTGEVTFRLQGSVQEPVWKGKIEFFFFGREAAADSVSLEKACPWNGTEFAPLR